MYPQPQPASILTQMDKRFEIESDAELDVSRRSMLDSSESDEDDTNSDDELVHVVERNQPATLSRVVKSVLTKNGVDQLQKEPCAYSIVGVAGMQVEEGRGDDHDRTSGSDLRCPFSGGC